MTRSTSVRSLLALAKATRFLRSRALVGLTGLATVGATGVAQAEDGNRIVGGVSESRFPGVGALLVEGDWFCSGTAIGKRVVLTAAHCLDGLSAEDGLEFFIGTDANSLSNGRRVRALAAHPHPNYALDDRYDVGVLLLEEDVGVATIPARLAPISADIVGKKALFVGFGLTVQNGDGGEKRSVEIPIAEVNDFFVGYATPYKNTCNGDSGGPALMDLGSGLEVIGVTSYGDADCSENGYNTRSDVFADWIQPWLEGVQPDAPTPPVGGETATDNADDGTSDFCAELGWYGDDYCDETCPAPDPDCSGDQGEESDWEDSGDESGWEDSSDDDSGWEDSGWDDSDSSDEDEWTGDEEASVAPDDQGVPTAPSAPTPTPTANPKDVAGLGCSGGSSPFGLAAALFGLTLVAARRRRV